MPIILVTAKGDPRDIIAGLESGGDEYLTKPVDHAALMARVKSILRIKMLHDTVQEQAAQLKEWNRKLEERVAQQVGEIERISRLKRFLSPQLAELVVATDDERLLKSHRSDVAVVFCDLRGFTAFAETAEPEEVMEVLHSYHTALGEIIYRFAGTLERFFGDGLMVLFNVPIPCENSAAQAVRMAIAMRDRVAELAEDGASKAMSWALASALPRALRPSAGSDSRADSIMRRSGPWLMSPPACAPRRNRARS